jgi:hypothetical protein
MIQNRCGCDRLRLVSGDRRSLTECIWIRNAAQGLIEGFLLVWLEWRMSITSLESGANLWSSLHNMNVCMQQSKRLPAEVARRCFATNSS